MSSRSCSRLSRVVAAAPRVTERDDSVESDRYETVVMHGNALFDLARWRRA
jgi:hypothetical protein